MSQKMLYILFSFFTAMFFQRAIFILFLISKKINISEIGFLQMTLLFSIIIADYPIGIMSDKYGRKLTLYLGSILMIVNSILMTLVDSTLLFLFIFIIEGVGFAAISNSLESLIYEDSQKSGYNFSRFFSLLTLFSALGLGFSIFIGGLSYEVDINYPYYETCIAFLFSLLILFFIKEENNNNNNNSFLIIAKSSMKFIANEMTLPVWKIVSVFTSIFCVTAPFIIFSQELLSNQGFSERYIGLIIGLSEILGAIIVFLASDFFSRKKVSLKYLVIIVLLSTLSVNFQSKIMFIISILILSTIAIYLSVILNREIHDLLRNDIRNSGMSIISSIIAIFMAIAYWGYGILIGEIGIIKALSALGFIPLITYISLTLLETLKKKRVK